MFVTGIFKNWRKIFVMSMIDLKSSFKASVLTWFWVVLAPLLTIGMYIFSFAISGDNVESIDIISYDYNDLWSSSLELTSNSFNRTGWLIIGVLTWTFVGGSLTSGSNSIRTYSWLVSKIGSPLYVPPTFTCLSKSYIGIGSIFISWIIYMIIAGCSGDTVISYNILQLPLMIILLFCFMLLWSIAVSPLCAISKDVFNVITILPMLLQWITGVFLPISNSVYNEPLGYVFRINPFNFLIDGIRGSIMSYSYIWNDWVSLVSFVCFFVILFVLASYITKRSKRLVVDLV